VVTVGCKLTFYSKVHHLLRLKSVSFLFILCNNFASIFILILQQKCPRNVNQTIVEWYFKNVMDNGDIEEFDGISLIEWSAEDQIQSLKNHFIPLA